MTLEELVYQYLAEQDTVTSKLAVFDSHPAIFYQQAPDDKDLGWGGRIQYPRMEYMISMQSNTERKSAGTLQITLFSADTAGTMPEEIEPELKAVLKDLLCSTGESVYATAWARTEAFTQQQYIGDVDTKVVGLDLFFDIMEFTVQETSDPDPIMAINQYAKEAYPNAVIIGWDKDKIYLKPSSKQPVIYCRLMGLEKVRVTNTVAWMLCQVSIHVICPDQRNRLKIIDSLASKMAQDEEIIMLDESPMQLKSLKTDSMADYLTQGQILISGEYGILRYMEKPKKAKINLLMK